MKKYELVIFDLDGTLLDTSQGIYNSVRYAEKEMGFAPIEDKYLRYFVGPPPKQMYQSIYEVDEITALKAAQKHREYGRQKAIYEARPYLGIYNVLSVLKEKRIKLAVATLKSQTIAETILKLYKMDEYFDVIVGMDEKESLTKCMTIERAIEKTNSTGEIVVVGDSQYDYQGAVEAGTDFIAALYGFGFNKCKTYWFPIIRDPNELLNIICG